VTADLSPDRFDIRCAVDDAEAFRFLCCKSQIPFSDPAVKDHFLLFETVLRRLGPDAGRPFFRPPQTDFYREIEQQGEIRFERTCGKVVQLTDECDIKPPTDALIGQRRVRKTVAEDPLPRFQCGEDGFPHMLGAGRCKQKQFRLGADGTGFPAEQDLANFPPERRSSRFSGCTSRSSPLPQPVRREFDLGGFPGPLAAFEGYKLAQFPVRSIDPSSR
jgi:hypothetical protein